MRNFRYPNKNCDVAKELPKWDTVKITDSKTDFWCDAEKMKRLVATKGAVLTAIKADDTAFQNFQTGVFNECSS